MNEVNEATIFEEGNVKITNLRAIVGSKTFVISKITSVSIVSKHDGPGFIPIFLIVVAFLIGFASLAVFLALPDKNLFVFSMLFGGIILALFPFGLAIHTINGSKLVYSVVFGTSSGDINVQQSYDKVHIQKIVDAINDAIVYQG